MTHTPTFGINITAESLQEMEENEKRLELLKQTDPKEYDRIMQPHIKLRRFMHQARNKSHSR